MTVFLSWVGVGLFLFLAFGLEDCVNKIIEFQKEKVQAYARAEEARLERAKHELELERLRSRV